jgi:F-type H+-transporting ATPase subunit b
MSLDLLLAQVGALIVQALPTLFLIVVLHFYLKAMLFKPLAKVLAERDALTKGAKQIAEASLTAASGKADQYEQALRDARNDIYKEQESMRKQWLDEQATQIANARTASEARVKTAREEIARDVEEARKSLSDQAAQLADKIAATIAG